MGKARYIYFDDEMNEKLEPIKNRSQLICRLLREYFAKNDIEEMNEEELEKHIQIIQLEKEMKKKMEEIQHG